MQDASNSPDVTEWLLAWSDGDHHALEQLMPIVYRELRRWAKRYMEQERPGHTLQATALVNEAYMRLADVNRMRWQNRAHFFAVSAKMMRRILVEYARRRDSQKRGTCVSLAGWSAEETAEVLKVSTDTVLRDWKAAKS